MVSTMKMLETTNQAWRRAPAAYDVFSPLCNLARGSLWREFCAGISLLRSHVEHISADLAPVARSNLKLLHRDFSKSQLYQESLSVLRKSTQINWRQIAHKQNIICGILHLPSGVSVDLDQAADPNSVTTVPDLVNKDSLCMIYVISGKMDLLSNQTDRSIQPRRLWPSAKPRYQYKSGAAMVIVPNSYRYSHVCRAVDNTQLLVVSYAKDYAAI